MNERRESRIPAPTSRATQSVLATQDLNDSRKRKAPLPAVPESSKRLTGFNTSTKPTKSAPMQATQPTASQVFSTAGFNSEGGAPTAPASGPAPGEETYEDIAARTGASVTDILGKRMAFRKGMKPEKKVEEMAPMIKEIRCGPLGEEGWRVIKCGQGH